MASDFTVPCPQLEGVIDVKLGAMSTANAPEAVTAPLSGLVIVRSRAETVAFDAKVTLTVRCVASVNVVEFTVIPVPLKLTAAPEAKFVPATTRFWLTAFCPRLAGVTELNVGFAFTVKAAAA